MRKKDEVSKTRKHLQRLQKLPENKYCAECGSKQPTWASVNLGVFVCIRCSSVHRAMGTHISKVKSATLDIWKMAMVKQFEAQGGNVKVNASYEAKLPKGQKPTSSSDMYLVERFIRDKYERKTWYSAKKPKVRKKSKDSSSGSEIDEKDLEDSDSSSSSEVRKVKKTKKQKKQPSSRKGKRKTAGKAKEKQATPLSKKSPELIIIDKKATPEPAYEPDILDLSVLSIDEPAPKTDVFDSKSFVDDLFSSSSAKPVSAQPVPQPSNNDADFSDFFGAASVPVQPAKPQDTSSPNQQSKKPSTNDILGMFKKSPQASPDLFGHAAPRGQPMRHMPPLQQPMRHMPLQPMRHMPPQQPNIMLDQSMAQPSAFRTDAFYPSNTNQMYPQRPMMNQQPMMNQPGMYYQQPPGRYAPVNLDRNRPLTLDMPVKPMSQSSAFDSLMTGNVPKKSSPPKGKSTSSKYVPTKPSGPTLNIDFGGWMK